MSYNIKVTKHFEKEAKSLFKKYPSLRKDIAKLVDELEINPELGTSLGNSLFKIRIAVSSKGRGKSGGARIITLVVRKIDTVYLVSIYDKSEYDSASTENLLRIIKEEGL